MRCRGSTLFDPAKKSCVYGYTCEKEDAKEGDKDDAEEDPTTTTTTALPTTCGPTIEIWPDTTDDKCKSYYLCLPSYSAPAKMRCRGAMVFDAATNNCGYTECKTKEEEKPEDKKPGDE